MFNSDNLRLDGKCAIITGAGAGIGKEIAITFATAGASVVVSDINADAANHVVDEIQQLGGQAFACRCDITSEQELSALADFAVTKLGKVDILVNNAGITRDNLLMRMKDDEWNDIIETNLSSVFRLSKAVMRAMMKKRHGRIITIGSVVGTMGNGGQANYAAAKAGLIGFSKSLAREVASRGITVNVVAPGFIETDMTRALSDDQRAGILAQVPAGRLGGAQEIANAVAFLASDEAAYITGETLHVNGGMYMV